MKKKTNIHRQETEVATGREKVAEQAIRKMKTQGEIAIKPKPVEEEDAHKKDGKNQDYQKTTPMKIRNCGPLRCKSTKCYKTKECQELHDKIHHLQQEREKIQELKERNYTVIFRKREHRCWNRGEDNCVNLFRVRNEDTPENQIEWVEKMRIYIIAYSPLKKMHQ